MIKKLLANLNWFVMGVVLISCSQNSETSSIFDRLWEVILGGFSFIGLFGYYLFAWLWNWNLDYWIGAGAFVLSLFVGFSIRWFITLLIKFCKNIHHFWGFMLTMSWFGFYIFALPDLLNIPLGFEVWKLASPIATFKQLFIAYTYFALQFRPFIIETPSNSISKVPEEEQNEE